MLIVLSPAKSLDYDTPPSTDKHTLPIFINESAKLVADLKKLSLQEVAELMDLSDKLAALNVARFGEWSKKFTAKNSKQAILAFNGDVYEGLDAASLSAKALDYTQDHVRVLSGLYGVLKPLDLMQPYRLEMGTAFKNTVGKDLYAFWGDKITLALKEELEKQKSKTLINLASDEYFKSVKADKLGFPIVAPVFQDEKAGKYKIVSFYAKRARGLMTRFIIDNKIDKAADLKDFDYEGYKFAPKESTDAKPVFRRKEQ
ncbi:MAG: hypothetical protein RJA32_1151 [Pseudomonadota bacterium]|jgi:cytoplasmic iron level regulating protein YaaA (DUF328/UPF0246 family)